MKIIRVIKKSWQHFLNRSLIAPGHLAETPAMVKKHEQFVKTVEIWDDTLNIKYGKFRNNIANICRTFNNQFDITVEYIDALEAVSGEGWVVIQDEDDLICPKLPRILRRTKTSKSIVKWDTLRTNSHTVTLWDAGCCPTGGFAFKLDELKQYHELLIFHGRTSKYEIEMIGDDPLGLIINQPSSHGILKSYNGDVSTKIKQAILRFVNPTVEIPRPYKMHFNRIIEEYKKLL